MVPAKKLGRPAFADPTRIRSAADHIKPIDRLLPRLNGVRRTGPGRWIARCPTRSDRSPSLSIRALPDGRVLLHDFGGDGVREVLSAIGLDLADLYPDRPRPPGPGEPHRERRPFAPEDALRCLDFEAMIVLAAAHDLRKGRALTDCELERLAEAVQRIENAREVAA